MGIPFQPISGPQNKNARIGIVGAGAAGVHMAYLLKKDGYTDVTILEKSRRIGGKADFVEARHTKNPVSATFWFTSGYKDTLIPLLDEFGFLEDASFSNRDLVFMWPSNSSTVSKKPEHLVMYSRTSFRFHQFQ